MNLINIEKDAHRYVMPVDSEGKPIRELAFYLRFLTAFGHAENTIITYATNIMYWYRYCEETGHDPLYIESTETNIVTAMQEFVEWMAKAYNHSASTDNAIISAVVNYFEYLERTNHFDLGIANTRKEQYFTLNHGFLAGMVKNKNVVGTYVSKPTEHRPIKYITRDQYNTLLDACTCVRDKVILGLMYEGGMRIGEVLGLHWSDLTIEDRTVTVNYRDTNVNHAFAKRKANRPVPIPDYLIDLILELLDEENNTDYLLVSLSGPHAGQPLTYKAVTKMIDRLEKKTGINFHCHMARHGFAVERINDAQYPMDLPVLKTMLGHVNVTSTQIYAEYLDETIREKAQRFFATRKAQTELYAHDSYKDGAAHVLSCEREDDTHETD